MIDRRELLKSSFLTCVGAVASGALASCGRIAPIRAYIPASDIIRARKFYEELIGLQPNAEYAGGVVYECGGAEVFMYPSPNAGTSRASQAFWQVKDVEAEVAELKARGVQFERYDFPGVTIKTAL